MAEAAEDPGLGAACGMRICLRRAWLVTFREERGWGPLDHRNSNSPGGGSAAHGNGRTDECFRVCAWGCDVTVARVSAGCWGGNAVLNRGLVSWA